MSDLNDTRVENNALRAKEQASLTDVAELLRNLMHRVAIDGSQDFNALQYLQGIAANTAFLGVIPQATVAFSFSDTDSHRLVLCQPNEFILVFDMVLSINDVANISLVDENGSQLLVKMYAPNAGQGFSFNSLRGCPLPAGKSLFVQSSAAVDFSGHISFAVISLQ